MCSWRKSVTLIELLALADRVFALEIVFAILGVGGALLVIALTSELRKLDREVSVERLARKQLEITVEHQASQHNYLKEDFKTFRTYHAEEVRTLLMNLSAPEPRPDPAAPATGGPGPFSTYCPPEAIRENQPEAIRENQPEEGPDRYERIASDDD
jgi:hypothetical protein